MNGKDKTQQHKGNAEKYLKQTDEKFFIDPASGLYHPCTSKEEAQIQKDRPGEVKKRPFFVSAESSWTDKVSTFFAALTVLVSALTLVLLLLTVTYTRKQWLEANKSARAAERTLKEIQKQTRLMRQEVTGNFAATIPVELPRPTSIFEDLERAKFYGVALYFANTGRVAATNLIVEAKLTKRRLPGFAIFGKPEARNMNVARVRPYDQTPVGIPGITPDDPFVKFSLNDFTPEDVALLHAMKEAIQIDGRFKYSDGFGNTIHQPLCFIYWIPPPHVFPPSGSLGATFGFNGGKWSSCRDIKDEMVLADRWQKEDEAKQPTDPSK